MANLTLAIDDDLLRQARIKAVQQGTSVNEICRQAIERFAAPATGEGDFMARLAAVGDRIAATAGAAEPAWPNRDALYDEALAARLPSLWPTVNAPVGDPGTRSR